MRGNDEIRMKTNAGNRESSKNFRVSITRPDLQF